jgi:hypothetical protein
MIEVFAKQNMLRRRFAAGDGAAVLPSPCSCCAQSNNIDVLIWKYSEQQGLLRSTA